MTQTTTDKDSKIDPYAFALGRLQVAAQRLLEAIDHEEIRRAALAHGYDIYTAAALLKDALAACPNAVTASPEHRP